MKPGDFTAAEILALGVLFLCIAAGLATIVRACGDALAAVRHGPATRCPFADAAAQRRADGAERTHGGTYRTTPPGTAP